MDEQSGSNEVKAQPAQLQAVIQIIRKATGKVEEYTITGTPIKDETEQKEAP